MPVYSFRFRLNQTVLRQIYKFLPVNFSFFDTDSNNYKTITAKGVEVSISNEEKKKLAVAENKTSIAEQSERSARIAGGIVVLLVLLILLYWIFARKETITPVSIIEKPALASVDDLLVPAQGLISEEGNQFYPVLHSVIWKFAGEQFGLAGSEMNKQALAAKMNVTGFDSNVTDRLFRVLQQCEAGMFTNASLEEDKQSILSETKELLGAIHPLIS